MKRSMVNQGIRGRKVFRASKGQPELMVQEGVLLPLYFLMRKRLMNSGPFQLICALCLTYKNLHLVAQAHGLNLKARP